MNKHFVVFFAAQACTCGLVGAFATTIADETSLGKVRILLITLSMLICAGVALLFFFYKYQPTPLASTHACVKLCWYIAFVACGGPLGLFSISKLSFGSSLGNINFAVTAGASIASALTVLHHLRYFNNEYTKLYNKQVKSGVAGR